jgi:hypothetical protein
MFVDGFYTCALRFFSGACSVLHVGGLCGLTQGLVRAGESVNLRFQFQPLESREYSVTIAVAFTVHKPVGALPLAACGRLAPPWW